MKWAKTVAISICTLVVGFAMGMMIGGADRPSSDEMRKQLLAEKDELQKQALWIRTCLDEAEFYRETPPAKRSKFQQRSYQDSMNRVGVPWGNPDQAVAVLSLTLTDLNEQIGFVDSKLKSLPAY